MDFTLLNDLPPLKRLRFKQQQQELQQQHQISCSPLPAKKRKESRNAPFLLDPPQSLPPSVSTTVYSLLPAKKRVCALQPHLISKVAISSFDLNVEFNPSLVEEEITKSVNDELNCSNDNNNPSSEKSQIEEDKDDDDDDDDDGILCAVCQSTDGDPTDPIVLCDGCDLMVHASCYGNPLAKGVPKGDWFCERCRFEKVESEKKGSFSCCLCPVKGGAMKPTTDKKWAHIVCALLVPEVYFEDPEGRDGIDCSKVPKKRWLESCYVCDSSNGCAIVCSEPKCDLAFHVTCGLKENLCIEYKQGKKGATIVAGFCKSHTELWEKLSGKYKIVAREDEK